MAYLFALGFTIFFIAVVSVIALWDSDDFQGGIALALIVMVFCSALLMRISFG